MALEKKTRYKFDYWCLITLRLQWKLKRIGIFESFYLFRRSVLLLKIY